MGLRTRVFGFIVAGDTYVSDVSFFLCFCLRPLGRTVLEVVNFSWVNLSHSIFSGAETPNLDPALIGIAKQKDGALNEVP